MDIADEAARIIAQQGHINEGHDLILATTVLGYAVGSYRQTLTQQGVPSGDISGLVAQLAATYWCDYFARARAHESG